tara:strand:+ start:2125 stop:2427 length:303 start_codon:yes stop_codon:yes gene_type:complete
MSIRRKPAANDATLRAELQSAQQLQASIESSNNETPSFDSLTPVEQAAGSLGVSPNEWKPIAFMNNAHFEALVKANALEANLVRRIEAFKQVANGGEDSA